MYCDVCGAEFLPGRGTCPRCGALAPAPSSRGVPPPSAPYQTQAPQYQQPPPAPPYQAPPAPPYQYQQQPPPYQYQQQQPPPFYPGGYQPRRHHEPMVTWSMILLGIQVVYVGFLVLLMMSVGAILPMWYGMSGVFWMFALVFLALLALGIVAIKYLYDFRSAGVIAGGIFSLITLLLNLWFVGNSGANAGGAFFFGLLALVALANLVCLGGSHSSLS